MKSLKKNNKLRFPKDVNCTLSLSSNIRDGRYTYLGQDIGFGYIGIHRLAVLNYTTWNKCVAPPRSRIAWMSEDRAISKQL